MEDSPNEVQNIGFFLIVIMNLLIFFDHVRPIDNI